MKTKRVSILLLSLGLFSLCSAQDLRYTLSSPDKAYEFCFIQEHHPDGFSQMYYTLSFHGKTIVEKSQLGVQLSNEYFESALGIPNDTSKIWSSDLRFMEEKHMQKDTVWVPLYGENSTIRDHYNALTLCFRKGDGKRDVTDDYNKERAYYMNLEVRAYNEGVAFRYHFPQATNGLFMHITSEQTQFVLPEGTQAYYEKWAQGPFHLLPLKDWEGECERPLTLVQPSGLTVVLAEAGLVDYVRTKFELDATQPHALRAKMYDSCDIITPYNTPWRVVMAAQKPIDLITREELLLNLNEPCALNDVSYIRPGKVIRACTLNQQGVKDYIDFAAAHSLQYVHLDSGWYGNEKDRASDATKEDPARDLNMQVLCDYARSKGIGIWLYVNQRALERQLDDMLPVYKKWGIVGIKFGFVQVGNQHWTTWLHQAVRKCADYGMMVDIHDEYRPTGVSRTLPNLMTQEGIRGNEEMPDAWHNTVLPFTRFLAGPADYTLCYYNNRIKTTHAHQLAMGVVYYSPITFLYWYDKPSDYRGEAETELWKELPTTWEETYPVDGAIGQYVAVARRSGKRWYLGVLNGLEGRTLNVPTDFLQKGKKYRYTLYQDNPALDTRTKVEITKCKAKGGKPITLTLQPSGGATVVIDEE